MKNLLASLLLFAGISTGANAAIILSLSAENENLSLGEDLVLNISASTIDGSAFTNFGLDLFQDATQLFASDMLVELGAMFTPFISTDGDALSGSVPAPAVPFMPFAVSGDNILLASITISGLNVGDYLFSVGADQGIDPNEGFFNGDPLTPIFGLKMADFSNAQLEVSVSEVSAPASIALVSLALLGLLARRK
uniref:hypothetical protein n=1 Tax=Ningiella ruwaisensis TaxID=2364274 RepID=UPI00109FE91F|nr:hypothetical protein [Ningiella ruwaisensis]